MKQLRAVQRRLVGVKRRDIALLGLGVVIAAGGFGLAKVVANNRTALPYAKTGLTIQWLPSTVKKWQPQIEQAGAKYNIDPNLIAILMTLESGGYAKAGSEADAKGLMQVTPLTAQDIAQKHLKTSVKNFDIWDPRTNIEFGTAYMSFLRDEFGTAQQGPDFNTTVELIAAGYNGGPSAANSLEQGKGLTDTQTVVYSRDAFNMWRERHAKGSPTFDRWKERGGIELIKLASTQE